MTSTPPATNTAKQQADQDASALKYAGMMGHEYVTVTDRNGKPWVSAELMGEGCK